MAKKKHDPFNIKPIYVNELSEYSNRPNPRMRLYSRDESHEMIGDGFLKQYGEYFYVSLDWHTDEPLMLKSGEIIGLEENGKMGFYPRRLVL